MNRNDAIEIVEKERLDLETKINQMIIGIGPIPIANKQIMPFGWRKAAKGRTVWRVIEEIISQNLEIKARELGLDSVKSAISEVNVYDFEFNFKDKVPAFVNIKSSVVGGRKNKDDISKATKLFTFFDEHTATNLYVATFMLAFNEDMTVSIVNCVVMPIAWIPDIYINPSNNGNLQSAQCKYIDKAVRRTNEEFLELLKAEYEVSRRKRAAKGA